MSLIPRIAALAQSGRLSGQAGWIAGPFALNQALRLGTNIVLARLLAPEVFGLMLLINTLRSGTELLSDIGITQSVVRSPNGDDDRFLNTAWTLQVLRGVLLMLIVIAGAYPIALIYDQPELFWIMIVVSPTFLLTALRSPAIFLIQRRMRLQARAVYDLGYTIFHCAFSIVLALFMPTVWALVIALVVSGAFACVLSYFIEPKHRPRFAWDRSHVREIVHFGKWIFLSTAVLFAASSYDRLYMVAALPLALAGIYGIARTFADILAQLAQQGGNLLIFPKVASVQHRRGEIADKLRHTRFKVLLLVALATGGAIAVSDQFILLAYDERYHAAAFMLPILLVGVWFGILSAFADAMLMGCSRPIPGARGNIVKFAILLIGLPLAVAQGNLTLVLVALVLAEFGRWLSLLPSIQGERFASFGDDLKLTALMIAVAVAGKFALGWLGIVPTLEEWMALEGLLNV